MIKEFHSPFLISGTALISPRHLQRAMMRYGTRNGSSGGMGAFDGFARRRAADDEEDDDDENEMWWMKEDMFGAKLPSPSMKGSTAIIPIKGVLTSGIHPVYRVIGYENAQQIQGWVEAAADDDAVKKIVLDIDSPGGMVTGTPELAGAVHAATQHKEVLAHTSGMMDSAAYWVGSQADAVYCTGSADVGCIGVYQITEDWSGFLKEKGIEVTMFKSGDLKATGHPDFPLTKEQKAYLQAEVDMIGEQFRGAVTSKRRLVEADSMRGQSFLGIEAGERHLVAGIKPLSALL